MKNFSIKITRIAITLILVLLGIVAVFKAWVFYTESPWTRDAKFTADVVAIAPDVSGLLTDVPVVDNQLVKKGQVLFVVDRPRYEQALAQASADVAYYQTLAAEKRREAGRRVKLGVQAMSQEEIDQSNNSLQTVQHQLAKAVATRELAQLDLERTTVRAPADGWITNLNVHAGEYITRGSVAVALVKKDSFYILAYLEETKLNGLNKGDRAEITPARQQPHHAWHRRQRGGGGEQQQQHGEQQRISLDRQQPGVGAPGAARAGEDPAGRQGPTASVPGRHHRHRGDRRQERSQCRQRLAFCAPDAPAA